ncbi:cation-chloride cotransporter 1-like [Pyrus ussuriensis x Pyrus communis]|uniref:Cation-chloride cotransporter 1-like n=1 Tax=Pyrus ussuriensis x Pyrus communis TaxID=2448454 RepID=A0A5N5HXP5_9ROSA|nr:cation-chloride cotransporter 1-like [Pyrus ussuriensis x Pyrus communis]
MDNVDVEAGAEDEFDGQRGCKYRSVVNDDCAVLEISPMDPSSSSSTSLPIHQALLKYVHSLYLRLRELNGG